VKRKLGQENVVARHVRKKPRSVKRRLGIENVVARHEMKWQREES
jgi:hypothetical protein